MLLADFHEQDLWISTEIDQVQGKYSIKFMMGKGLGLLSVETHICDSQMCMRQVPSVLKWLPDVE